MLPFSILAVKVRFFCRRDPESHSDKPCVCQLSGPLSGDAVRAHEHGRGHRLLLEPRHGGLADLHPPVSGRVLPRPEPVHGRRNRRRREGLSRLIAFMHSGARSEEGSLRDEIPQAGLGGSPTYPIGSGKAVSEQAAQQPTIETGLIFNAPSLRISGGIF